MNPKDKISKSSWNLLDAIRDSVSANVATAVRSGQLKVEAQSVQSLLNLINASLDEGYHKGHKSFMKSVEGAITEATTKAVTSPVPSTKKK